MEHCVESIDYLKYYMEKLQSNLVSLVRPYESKAEIGLELLERYAETFVILLKFFKQEFTYEQTHAHSLALYQKYREGSDSVDLTWRIEKRREAIVKLIASDNPDPDGIVFLQNWCSPVVWRHYKIVFTQFASEWDGFKNTNSSLVEQLNRTPLYKSVYDALNELSGISELTFYRES